MNTVSSARSFYFSLYECVRIGQNYKFYTLSFGILTNFIRFLFVRVSDSISSPIPIPIQVGEEIDYS